MAIQEDEWLWTNSNKKSDKIMELKVCLEELKDDNAEILSKLRDLQKKLSKKKREVRL